MNKFLDQADKQWEKNGLLTEKAILLVGRILAGDEPSTQELEQCQSDLLSTLMVDTPSGMFESALASMVKG